MDKDNSVREGAVTSPSWSVLLVGLDGLRPAVGLDGGAPLGKGCSLLLH